MYCDKCGNQNLEDSIFCKKCGVKIEESTPSPTKENKKSPWKLLVSLAGGAVGWAVGQVLGLVFFFLAIGFLVGYWFAKRFIKTYPDSKFFLIIAWLNIISWVSPILGFLTAGITFAFAQNKKQKKYHVLWILAVVLAIGNALLYPYVTGSRKTGLSDYKTRYKSSYIKVCTNLAGISSQKYCTCKADYLVNNNTETQLSQIAHDYKTTHQKPQAVQDAESSCVGTKPNPKQ